MQPDLELLRITLGELEHLTGMEISETFMGRAYRPSVFRHSRRFWSFVLTELLGLGLILIFCLPMGLVLGRGLGVLTEKSAAPFLGLTLGGAIVLFAGWNLYMMSQTKSLKTLAHLLDEVDKHNDIIQAVHIIDELSAVQQSAVLIDRSEICQALQATRASLISALMTERILRQHQHFVARRHELFSSIETSLATLQTLQLTHQAHEYGELLHEALSIGLSVRQELESWQRSPE